MKLLPKILLAVVSPVLAGAGTAWLLLAPSWQRAADQALIQASELAQQRAADLAAALQQQRETLRALAATPALRTRDPAPAAALLAAWQPAFDDLRCYTLDGRVRFTDGPPQPVDDRGLRAALAAGQPAAIDDGRPGWLVAVGGDAGSACPVLAGAPRRAPLFATLSAERPGLDAHWLLLERDGTLLSGRVDVAGADLGPATEALRAAAEAGLSRTLLASGQAWRLQRAPVAGSSWRLVLVQPEDEMLAPMRQLRALAIALLVGALVLAVLSASVMHRLISRPLARLTGALQQLQSGDRAVRAAEGGDDELSALARAFNQMAAALAASEQRLRTVFEAFPHPILLNRLPGGEFIDANPAYLAAFRLSRDQIVGRRPRELGPLDLTIAPEELAATLLRDGRIDNVEARIVDDDGRTRWALCSSRRVQLDGGPAALTVATDITSLKLADERLRASERNFNALFQHAPLPLAFTVDGPAPTGSHWNQAWYRAFGYTPEQAEGLGGNDFGWWVEPADRRRYIKAVRAAGHIHDFATTLRCADGTLRQCLVSGRFIELAERRLLITGVVDITEAQRSRQALDRLNQDLAGQVALAQAVTRAQSQFITDSRSREGFESLLRDLLALTGSAIGFIGEVFDDERGQPFLRTHVISDLAWDEPTRRHYEQHATTGLEFRRPDTLLGAALRSGQPVIANQPASDPRAGGLPPGHPPLHNFIGMPVHIGGRLVAMVGLANRPAGFDEALTAWLEPLLASAGQMVQARRAAAAREVVERRLRLNSAMVDSSNDAMLVMRDGVFVDCNPAAPRLFGLPAEQIIGRGPLDLSPPRQADGRPSADVAAELIERARAGEPQRFEWQHLRGDGTRFVVDAAMSRHVEVSADQLVVVLRDITERQQAAAALRASEERLKLIIGTMAEGMSLHDAGGRLIDINPAGERLFGIGRELLLGRPVDDMRGRMHHEDGRPFERSEFPVVQVLDSGQSRRDIVGVVQRRDGRAVWLSTNAEPLLDEQGRVTMVVATFSDVTVRMQAEIALRRSEERFRRLFDHAPVPLLYTDQTSAATQVNQAWRRVVGWDADDLPTMAAWYERAYPDPAYREAVRRQWNAMVEAAGDADVGPLEVEVRCKDGQQRAMAIGRGPVENGYILSVYDLTERKQAEAALAELNTSLEQRVAHRTRELAQANAGLQQAQRELVRSEKLAALGSLVAGVAHELNTPIGNAVMVASALADQQRQFEAQIAAGLRRSVLSDFLATLREAGEVLERNLQRSAELISSFKQVAVDQSSYQRRRFELAEVVHEIGLALRPTLRQAAVNLVDEVPAGLLMDSYPGPLGQVLMNLVNNAVVHGFAGRAGGTVRVAAGSFDGERLWLRVSDDGGGIAAEHLGRVFDPFFTTRLGQGGSGLGLHICYSLVTGLLGGRIEVHSEPGAGTRFDIELPLRAPRTGPSATDLAAEANIRRQPEPTQD